MEGGEAENGGLLVSQTVLTGLERLEAGTDLYLDLIRWKVLVVLAKAKSRRCEGKNVHQVTQEEMRTDQLGTESINEEEPRKDCSYHPENADRTVTQPFSSRLHFYSRYSLVHLKLWTLLYINHNSVSLTPHKNKPCKVWDLTIHMAFKIWTSALFLLTKAEMLLLVKNT